MLFLCCILYIFIYPSTNSIGSWILILILSTLRDVVDGVRLDIHVLKFERTVIEMLRSIFQVPNSDPNRGPPMGRFAVACSLELKGPGKKMIKCGSSGGVPSSKLPGQPSQIDSLLIPER